MLITSVTERRCGDCLKYPRVLTETTGQTMQGLPDLSGKGCLERCSGDESNTAATNQGFFSICKRYWLREKRIGCQSHRDSNFATTQSNIDSAHCKRTEFYD